VKICERSTRPESFPRLYRCKTFKPKGSVTFADDKGEPWFVTAEVCKVLVLSNPTVALIALDEDEKAKLNLGLPGSDSNIISESGLYAQIMISRKSEAKVHILLSCVDDDEKKNLIISEFQSTGLGGNNGRRTITDDN